MPNACAVLRGLYLAALLSVAACSAVVVPDPVTLQPASVPIPPATTEPTPRPTATPGPAPLRTPPPTLRPTLSPRPTPIPTVQPPPPTAAPASTPAFAPTGPTQEAFVLRVIDGDTIEVEIEDAVYRVRYIGIDTPETVHPHRPVEWLGPEASATNAAMVAGRTVVLETDVSEMDRYGRLLRYVWTVHSDRWMLVNLELLRLGLASVSTYPPDVKYVDPLYLPAQRQAQLDGRGIWGQAP